MGGQRWGRPAAAAHAPPTRTDRPRPLRLGPMGKEERPGRRLPPRLPPRRKRGLLRGLGAHAHGAGVGAVKPRYFGRGHERGVGVFAGPSFAAHAAQACQAAHAAAVLACAEGLAAEEALAHGAEVARAWHRPHVRRLERRAQIAVLLNGLSEVVGLVVLHELVHKLGAQAASLHRDGCGAGWGEEAWGLVEVGCRVMPKGEHRRNRVHVLLFAHRRPFEAAVTPPPHGPTAALELVLPVPCLAAALAAALGPWTRRLGLALPLAPLGDGALLVAQPGCLGRAPGARRRRIEELHLLALAGRGGAARCLESRVRRGVLAGGKVGLLTKDARLRVVLLGGLDLVVKGAEVHVEAVRVDADLPLLRPPAPGDSDEVAHGLRLRRVHSRVSRDHSRTRAGCPGLCSRGGRPFGGAGPGLMRPAGAPAAAPWDGNRAAGVLVREVHVPAEPGRMLVVLARGFMFVVEVTEVNRLAFNFYCRLPLLILPMPSHTDEPRMAFFLHAIPSRSRRCARGLFRPFFVAIVHALKCSFC
mmetsp:Transcript_19058/g.43179  ORF Transcript_19058/g.43179 Transcript_19058/m.43179 type:complete len:529 (-) Transcript_19058:89-1675(-)